MKKIIFILAAIEATFSLRAQTNIDDVLKAVEQNNTTCRLCARQRMHKSWKTGQG